MAISYERRFADWQIDEAINHFERVLEGARNSNQAAEDALQTAYEALFPPNQPHMHVAGTTVGKHIDECALCGRDLRNPIHSTVRP